MVLCEGDAWNEHLILQNQTEGAYQVKGPGNGGAGCWCPWLTALGGSKPSLPVPHPSPCWDGRWQLMAMGLLNVGVRQHHGALSTKSGWEWRPHKCHDSFCWSHFLIKDASVLELRFLVFLPHILGGGSMVLPVFPSCQFSQAQTPIHWPGIQGNAYSVQGTGSQSRATLWASPGVGPSASRVSQSGRRTVRGLLRTRGKASEKTYGRNLLETQSSHREWIPRPSSYPKIKMPTMKVSQMNLHPGARTSYFSICKSCHQEPKCCCWRHTKGMLGSQSSKSHIYWVSTMSQVLGFYMRDRLLSP